MYNIYPYIASCINYNLRASSCHLTALGVEKVKVRRVRWTVTITVTTRAWAPDASTTAPNINYEPAADVSTALDWLKINSTALVSLRVPGEGLDWNTANYDHCFVLDINYLKFWYIVLFFINNEFVMDNIFTCVISKYFFILNII